MNALKVDLWPCFFISLSDSTLANESEKNSFGYDSHWTEIDNSDYIQTKKWISVQCVKTKKILKKKPQILN